MTTPESSGRWDASGRFEDSVSEQRIQAFNWASSLSIESLHYCITAMASDRNSFTLYEQSALLQVVALHLRKELDG